MHLDNISKISLLPSHTTSVSFYGQNTLCFHFLCAPHYIDMDEAFIIEMSACPNPAYQPGDINEVSFPLILEFH